MGLNVLLKNFSSSNGVHIPDSAYVTKSYPYFGSAVWPIECVFRENKRLPRSVHTTHDGGFESEERERPSGGREEVKMEAEVMSNITSCLLISGSFKFFLCFSFSFSLLSDVSLIC